MCQKLPVSGFKWKENMSKFTEEFIIEVDVKYPNNLHGLIEDLPFLPERMKIGKCKKLVCNFMIKKLCCSHKVIKTSLKSWINIKKGS